MPAALRTFAKRLLSGKIHRFRGAVLLAVRAEIELRLEVVAELKHGLEAFAFPAAKTAQRPDLFVAHESLELLTAQQSAGDGFPNREIAVLICAGETFESLDNRRTALRTLTERLAIGHVFVGMKMFRFTNDVLCEVADIAHERVARELAMLDFAQTKFPFTGQFRARQFRHRALQKRDGLDCFRGWLQFLAVSR